MNILTYTSAVCKVCRQHLNLLLSLDRKITKWYSQNIHFRISHWKHKHVSKYSFYSRFKLYLITAMEHCDVKNASISIISRKIVFKFLLIIRSTDSFPFGYLDKYQYDVINYEFKMSTSTSLGAKFYVSCVKSERFWSALYLDFKVLCTDYTRFLWI